MATSGTTTKGGTRLNDLPDAVPIADPVIAPQQEGER
jgi:hypothetical protein